MKYFIYGAYILVLLIPVFTWFQAQGSAEIDTYSLANLAGLVAFTVIFLQITIGSFMSLLRPILGSKAILNFHIWQGIAAFIVAHLHPGLFALSFGLDRVLAMQGYAMWGKIALILIVLTVAAGLLRTLPFMQKYWRWVHRLNYVIFALVYWHSWNLGNDVRTMPMVLIYWLSPVVVIAGLIYRLFYSKIRVWELATHSEN